MKQALDLPQRGWNLSRERGSFPLSLTVAETHGWNNGPWNEMNRSTGLSQKMLDECIDGILAGDSPETCLRGHTIHCSELEPPSRAVLLFKNMMSLERFSEESGRAVKENLFGTLALKVRALGAMSNRDRQLFNERPMHDREG